MPDDTATAWMVMVYTNGAPAEREIIKRVREVHGPQLKLRIIEASDFDGMGQPERAQALLDEVLARARELGDRYLLGWAIRRQGDLLYRQGRVTEALPRYREAERAFAEAGLLPPLAWAIRQRAAIQSELGLWRDAYAGLDEAAALQRRLGNRRALAGLLITEGRGLGQLAEIDLAEERLEQARVELEALGAPLLPYLGEKANIALFMADLRSVRDLISRLRSGSDVPVDLEAQVLSEEDHLEQARSAFLEVSKGSERGGLQLMAFAYAISACAVDCSGAHPEAGSACLADVCRSWSHATPSTKEYCLVQQALCSYRMQDLAGAERASQDALAVPGLDHEDLLGTHATATSMRIAAARGDTSKAIPALRGLLSRLESKHARLMGFEVSLALGEAELRAGLPEGRPRLLKLEKEARSRECFRLARLAREALAGEAQLRAGPQR
jgi:tetratricopeptide (TPR) repeat protein